MQRLHDWTIHRRRVLVDERRLQTELVQIRRNGINNISNTVRMKGNKDDIPVLCDGLSIGTAFEVTTGVGKQTACRIIGLLLAEKNV